MEIDLRFTFSVFLIYIQEVLVLLSVVTVLPLQTDFVIK